MNLDGLSGGLVKGRVSAHAAAAINDKCFGGSAPNYAQVAADAFGNTLGNFVAGEMGKAAELERQARLARWTDGEIARASARTAERLPAATTFAAPEDRPLDWTLDDITYGVYSKTADGDGGPSASQNSSLAMRDEAGSARVANGGSPLSLPVYLDPTAAKVSSLASEIGAYAHASFSILTGSAKSEANLILNKAGALHADKIKQIIAVGFLEDAQAVIKTPTDKSAEAMAKYGSVVKYAHGLGVVSTAVEIGADMYADPSTATAAASVANIAGSSVSALVGAKIGGGLGLLGGPAAPVTVPAGAAIGSAIGTLSYEFLGGSKYVKTNVKQWWSGNAW